MKWADGQGQRFIKILELLGSVNDSANEHKICKSLEEAKDNYAKELDYEGWRELQEYHSRNPREIEAYMDEICIRAQKAALEKAAEYFDMHWNKSSITNPENLIR